MVDAAWSVVAEGWPLLLFAVLAVFVLPWLVGWADRPMALKFEQAEAWLNETEPCPRCGGAGRVPKEGGRGG